MIKIIIVEDDRKLNQIVCTHLNKNGYSAKGCMNVNEAYNVMYNDMYDLVISDIMMPDVDGFELAETLRECNPSIPILFMTARDDLDSMQRGYKLGIDEYMVKPINLDELVLRIGAILRRANIINTKIINVGNLTMNSNTMTVTVNDIEVSTSIREFNILYKLLSYPGQPFSRAQLMDEFWGIDSDASLRAVDVYITKIRDKFSNCNGFKIMTLYGLGYKAVLV
ncbi:response regulator transcription factor [Paenibacillus illinoisensis]|uniref:response regulator transcription factor n=1 Tax=Paenibacillus illinoisensis TaxID=59845 RepID=UPI001C8DCA32|nr:response regulator transcription factor [Paenibacillus illinoisensis]MBY0217797.1 response regulator transcription factor [Paenibacillus illinoisensis]